MSKPDPQMTWQPIETALKEWGTFILLYGTIYSHHKDDLLQSSGTSGRPDGMYVGCWSPGHKRWVIPDMMPSLNRLKQDWVEIDPTHWMELPDAP